VPLLVCDSCEVRARVPVTTAAAVAGQQAPPNSPPQRGVETLWLCLGEVGHSMESALRRLRPPKRGAAMATDKKAKHTGEKAKGKVKEAAGKVTGKKRLEAEGKADQGKADVKQSGKKVKNAAKKVRT
jgi:uncharacterized protein YjbJ (UPF0337 family)